MSAKSIISIIYFVGYITTFIMLFIVTNPVNGVDKNMWEYCFHEKIESYSELFFACALLSTLWPPILIIYVGKFLKKITLIKKKENES